MTVVSELFVLLLFNSLGVVDVAILVFGFNFDFAFLYSETLFINSLILSFGALIFLAAFNSASASLYFFSAARYSSEGLSETRDERVEPPPVVVSSDSFVVVCVTFVGVPAGAGGLS